MRRRRHPGRPGRWRRPGRGVLPALLVAALTSAAAACTGAPDASGVPGTSDSTSGSASSPTSGPGASPSPPAGQPARVLVFTRTAGFRHPSIADARAALTAAAAGAGLRVDLTEDPGRFTDAGLAPYRAVVFVHATGHVLDPAGQAALERWVAAGHGWAGVHAAADGDRGWVWYGRLVGARFRSHPPVQRATVRVADRGHPSTRRLPAALSRTDEWYDFSDDPRGRVHVLATVDEATYAGGRMGIDHPVAWCQAVGGGRSWYTALGHTPASWREPAFVGHVLGGIRWAAGVEAGDCG